MDDRPDSGGARAATFFVPAALIALLLPVLAGRPGTQVQPAAAPRAGDTASDARASLPPPSSGLRMLEAHLGRPSTADDLAALRLLIATIPDPILSRLDYTYDRYLDAIQRALETDGYRLDRFDLQWMRQRSTLEEQLKQATGAEPPSFARQPGLMLFRHDQRAPLLLFLVGETPTGGVQKEALTDALAQYAALKGWLLNPADIAATVASGPPEGPDEPQCGERLSEEDRVIRLVGPSFSGSGESVGRALRQWYLTARFNGPRPCARVVSGAATTISYNSPIFSPDSHPLPELVFSTTVVPDFVARNAFIHYLTSVQGVSCRHIALLTEANTAYGRHFADEDPADSRYALKYDDPCGREILTLPFPLHVAELRDEAERTRPARSQDPADLLSPTRRNLPVGLTEGRVDRSVVAWASEQEAATAELILSNLLTTVAQEGIRYAGLFSTDIKDRIFLAREIRQSAPDVTLFTYTSDQLYLHTDYNAAFRGMLVVSPYPLFSPNQVWTEPHEGVRSRLLFPNGNAQGVYNAVLTLLGRDDLMIEYARPFETAVPGTPTAPPLWLSVVGRDAIWPVALLDYEPLPFLTYQRTPAREAAADAARNLARARQLGEQGILTRTATTILFGLVAACAIGGLAILRALGLRPRSAVSTDAPAPGSAIRSGFGEQYLRTSRDDGTFDSERWTYVVALAALVAALHVVVCAVLVLPAWSLSRLLHVAPWAVGSWLLAGCRLVSLVSLLIQAAVLARLVMQLSRQDHGWRQLLRRPRGLVPAGVSLTLLAGTVALTGGWLGQPPVETLLLGLRASHLFSGVSPLVPVVLVGAAGVLWCLCSLSRLHSNDAMAGLKLLEVDEPSWANIASLEQRVRRYMTCPPLALPRAAVWSVIVLLSVAVVGLIGSTSGTIEPGVVEGLLLFAFTAGYAGLALAFVRGVYIWSALKDLVTRVGHHPLSLVLAPLYKECAGRLQIDPARVASATSGLSLSIGGASSLARALDGQIEESTAALMRAEAAVAESQLLLALEAEARGDWVDCAAATRGAHAALGEVSRATGPLLAPYWSLALGGLQGGRSASAGTPPPWVALAERFVAMRLADFLCWARGVLNSLTRFVTVAIVLMLMAVSSYPFQPASQVMLFNWVIVLSLVSATVAALVQMSRDRVLSDLSGTKPGELTFNRQFAVRLLIYGAVPILGLLGAQFPDVVGRLQPWVASLAGVK